MTPTVQAVGLGKAVRQDDRSGRARPGPLLGAGPGRARRDHQQAIEVAPKTSTLQVQAARRTRA
jgi:hypothetical protein